MASSIPRFSPPSFNNTVAPLEINTAQGADAPRERRTLHQMEQELNEWAKYPAEGENRIDTKEKILAAYQNQAENPPELLELDNIGIINTTPNLPKCVEDLDCKIECTFLENLNENITATGTWQYIPESEGIGLTDGTVYFKNGNVHTGKYQYIRELESMGITDGTCHFKNGTVWAGTWQYIRELESMGITDGTIQYKNGNVETGKFQYIPTLKGIYLTNGTARVENGEIWMGEFQYIKELNHSGLSKGKIQHPDGQIDKGTFQYIKELGRIKLTDGTAQLTNSNVATGKWQYIPELKNTDLTDGTIQYKNGSVLTGKRQYIPELKNMGLTDGTFQFKNGTREEGIFKYSTSRKCMALFAGTITQPDGAQVQRTQMQFELTEWAKEESPGENRNATKEKILAAYKNPPELLELDHIGFTDKTPNLPKCLENLTCKIKCRFLENNLQEGTATGLWQYIAKRQGMALTRGTRHFQNGRIEEGTFKYIKNTNRMELLDGIVTKPDGKREQIANGQYSVLLRRMSYTTKKLSSVAPPSPPAKLTLPVPKPTEQASTSTQPTQPTVSEQPKVENTAVLESQASASGSTDQDAPTVDQPSTSTPQVTPLLVAEPNSTQIQAWPKDMQGVLSQLRDMPLDQLKSFLSNGLGNIVTMPQLPRDLHNSEAHRNFFKGFTGLLDEHYFMLRSINVGAIEEEVPSLVKGISMALQALSLPGTAVAGGAIAKVAQLLAQAHAEKKARHIVQQFTSDLHFTITAWYAGVLLAQNLDQLPELHYGFLKETKQTLKELAVQAHLQSDNPYKHIPQVLDAYTLFLKTVKKHPEMMREVHASKLSFQDQCETAATRLVSQGLGIAIELPQTEGSSRAGSSTHEQEIEWVEELIEVREVPETPDSEPAESSEVQQLKEEVAELKQFKTLFEQFLTANNAGGITMAQTLSQMQGVGGEVYAPMATSSTADERRLRTHSLQIHELTQVIGNMAPAVYRHEQDLHAIKAPDTEFDNLKDMVTASAHYLRRFGVINYANTPITVRLGNGREVDLAEKLKKLHDQQPRASLKPYRPRVELQSLIGELDENISELADLDLEGGKRKLGAVVAQRTREDKVYTHNTDVVKMASYYLRRFGLVNYTSGEAKIQLVDQESEVSVADALADIHKNQPNASRKQYRLQHLLEHLVMKLPDEVKDALDLELDENAALLSRLQENMALKRDPRLPVSLRELPRQAQERQRLLGE